MSDTRERFAPTIMVIDDDKLVTKRWRREFHNRTSLGVVVANRIVDAANIVESGDVQIDAIVSDLIFDHGTDDPNRHLHSGVDFLAWISSRSSDVPMFVMSATDRMLDFKTDLEEREVEVQHYFDKFVSASGEEPAWLRIQRAILERKFATETAAISALNDIDHASNAIARLQLSVRTYIQEIPGREDIEVIKPIETICVAQKGGIKAYAPSLGLLNSVREDTVSDAVERLASAIGDETDVFLTPDPNLDMSTYAQRVVRRFTEYMRRRS